MLAIRLQRVGRKKQPLYRVVVSEKTKDMYGNHLELLGTYNPHTKDTDFKEDRIKYWLSQGAQASETVHNLFLKAGIVEGDKKKAVSITKKRQAKLAEKNKVAEVKEVPAEEKSAEETPSVEAEKAEEPKAETPVEENKEENKE